MREELGPGLTRLRLYSAVTPWMRYQATAYLFGGLLIDAGFAHVRQTLLEHLAGCRISAVCCTHHHEDHAGNAAALARQHGCPVYLLHPEARWDERVQSLPLYRRLWWGPVEPYTPLAMPEELRDGDRVLRAIPSPGHSRTHVVFYEERSGRVFSGDLFLSAGASAVMPTEDPYALVSSLRRVAALSPSVLLTGHGGVVEQARRALHTKAARVEQAADRAAALHERGLAPGEIVRRVFPRGRLQDLWYRTISAGDYSRINFVYAAIARRQAR